MTVEQDVQLQFVTLEQLVNSHAVDSLQSISFWVIVGLFPASVAIGWLVADRALRPIGAITAVAKDIQQTEDLTRRIDLEGPDDELKDLANTFDGMLDRIEDGMHARRTFVQDISHELRNPLAVMATNLDIVLSDPDTDLAEYQETARVVRRTVDRTARTVDELVVFARDEVPTSRRSTVDLSLMLTEVVDEHRGPIEARGISIERFGGAVTVAVDHVAMKRAISNLMSNAVRLTRPGSTVRCGSGMRDGLAWVAVGDEGPGLDPRDHEHVFRRGWSGNGGSIGGEGRSGLGLAITRQVAEAHGGMVTLRSTLGEGAEFVLWIPATPSADVRSVSHDGIHHQSSPA